MFGLAGILIALISLTIILAIFFLIYPAATAGPTGKVLAFVALFILPSLCVAGGMNEHMQRSEQTTFCISCHAMEPYGRSLYVDDPSHIPAQHFQNHRVPADRACYSCHANYTIYGPFKDKLAGLRRVYMQYVGTPPKVIKIAGGYSNLQCLHCHAGARNFQENPVHQGLMDSIVSNQMSCISSGCHDTVHNVATLSHAKFWSPVP